MTAETLAKTPFSKDKVQRLRSIDSYRNHIYRAPDGSINKIYSSLGHRQPELLLDDTLSLKVPDLFTRFFNKKAEINTTTVTREIRYLTVRYGADYEVVTAHANYGKIGYEIAVKRFPQGTNGNAIEQFQAMSALEAVGISCALTLAANKTTLITKWVDAPLVSSNPSVSAQFLKYLENLKTVAEKLKAEGKWKPNWKINTDPNNYAVRNPIAKNLSSRFTAISPVSI